MRLDTVGGKPEMGLSTETRVAMAEILGTNCECLHLVAEGASRAVEGSDDSTRIVS